MIKIQEKPQKIDNFFDYKQQWEGTYRQVITELKILSMRADYKGKKSASERYKNAWKKLELIQERSHLTEIGKEGAHKENYKRALKIIEERFRGEDTIEYTVEGIEELCKNLDDRDEKDGKEEKECFETER